MKLRPKHPERRVQALKILRTRGKRSLNMLPNLFTVGNLAAGVVSIVFAAQGQFMPAAWMIVFSMILDGLDGRVARLLHTDGEFGLQLDSLADVISFGTAPAILMYQMELHRFGSYGLAVAVLFPVAGALRLARFNILRVSGHFVGLPITAAGGLVALLVLYGTGLASATTSFVMLVLAYLMISAIPYPSFKKRVETHIRPLPFLLPVIAVAFMLKRDPHSIIVLPLILYAMSGPYLLLLRGWGKVVAPRVRSLSLRLRGL
ncbi:MAG: CDP-diacylglycerol--serine O-phosphatidyltransferase [Symbiobacteriia bacterium]